jgi:hypothetical protein
MTLLAIGDKVQLRYAPVGDVGTVIALARGKVRVQWGDLQLVTKHAPEALLPYPGGAARA